MTVLASQQVIDAIVARLQAAATDAGSRWFSGRYHPVNAYPAGKVMHDDEDMASEPDDVTWPPTLLHTLRVDVQWYAQASADLDAAMAEGARQVLQCLQSAQQPLAPLNVVLQPAGLRYQAQGDGQASVGIATVSFIATFATIANAPHVIT